MLFNSLTFVLFLVLVVTVYRLPLGWRAQKLWLLVASYAFYAAWNPPFVVLLWISTIVDWQVGKRLPGAGPQGRRLLLGASLLTNLGLLGYFKYGEFALDSLTRALAGVGIAYAPPELDIVLPVGISFYTFQTLSYTLDIARGRLKPHHSLADFALFVTFFPQLVAGPIVRAAHFLPQLAVRPRSTAPQASWACTLFLCGLFSKVILSDTILAPVSDSVFGAAEKAGALSAWTGMMAFSGQIFFDFAGYSACAIGLGLLLGFQLPDNFRYPYAAVGFSDFWTRWHISLSQWLRDYLYIPLGGNRHGSLATYRNLMLTMLIGGLWHGASWRFVAWGGLHGLFLVLERGLRRLFGSKDLFKLAVVRALLALGTFLGVTVAWIFFRAESFGDAFLLLQGLFGARPESILLPDHLVFLTFGTVACLCAAHGLLRQRSLEETLGRWPWPLRAVFLSFLLIAICLAPGDDRAFIYFQF